MDKKPRQRLDKWLWHARFGRTRTLASKTILNGGVRVNRAKITKPAYTVSPGDVLTLLVGGSVQVIRIISLQDKRQSPEGARLLYDMLSDSSFELDGRLQRGSAATFDVETKAAVFNNA
jgi:ribosome-associated heat shock protein Hsp15